MPSSSALLAAAAAYLDALASYERARILAVLSEDYEHTLAPASIGVESPISRDAFVPMACNLQAVISRFSFRIKQAWPNEAEGRVTVWAEGEGDLRPHIKQSSGEDYSLKREYMFVLEMDSSGEKVEKALENQNLSHITTGHIDNSPSKKFVRVVQAYDGIMASSFFNYANVTKEGLVDNTLTAYNGQSTTPEVWRGYVSSNFPLFSTSLLVDAGAVFGGLVKRNFINTPVAAWNIMYQGVIPVTVFVDNCHVVVGYDYFSPELRTRVITDLFNIQV
ncbi:hypothetical protein ACJ41O_008836 [Fusarium nematophilum]